MRLQLRHLNYFIAVAEELNFRKASERLFVSQPTLSHQIAQLEDILGVQLFTRDKRHVVLTEAGVLLHEKATHIMETIEVSIAQVQDLAVTKPLIVGVPNYHTFDVISDALQAFSSDYPDAPLEIQEMSSLEMRDALHRRKIDIGFMALPFPPPGEDNLKFKLIAKEPYMVCVSKKHTHIDQAAMDCNALKDSKFFLLPRTVHPTFHDFVIAKMREMGFEPQLGDEAASTQAQYGLVAADLGVCLALESSPIPPGNLTVKPFDPPILYHELMLAWHEDNSRIELEKFCGSAEKIANKFA